MSDEYKLITTIVMNIAQIIFTKYSWISFHVRKDIFVEKEGTTAEEVP